ncbi:MAG: sensor histidine kinase [Lachnospiraceae bacterium]
MDKEFENNTENTSKYRWGKFSFQAIGYILLAVLAGALLYYMTSTANSSFFSSVLDVEIEGEYRIGDSKWQPLDQNTRVSAFDGDLVLRGLPLSSFPMALSFYQDHIGVSISVEGEPAYLFGRVWDEVPEMVCASVWNTWEYSEADAGKEIEIRLHNPHKYGNGDAYQEFLNSLCFGGGVALQDLAGQESRLDTIAGMILIVASIAILGISISYLVQRISVGSLLWSIGWMCLFMGGYIMMDTKDIPFRNASLIFNTCLRQFCLMFFGLTLVVCVRKILTGKVEKEGTLENAGENGKAGKVAGVFEGVLELVCAVLLISCFAGLVGVYDTGLYYAIALGIIGFILLCLCVREYGRNRLYRKSISDRQNSSERENIPDRKNSSDRESIPERLNIPDRMTDQVLVGSSIVMLLLVEAELLNGRMSFLPGGILLKAGFLLLFAFHIVRAVRLIASQYSTSIRAEKLEGELKNSRVVLAMSQIRSHFLFNVLNAISGLCKYDPEKADEMVVRFARYLRKNIDTMQKDELTLFTKEMEHLEDYIMLEQVRFGEKIGFRTDIQVSDFLLPPLVLQPVVENAIKHGILSRPDGGTILLSTTREKQDILITIQDDGVGFEPDAKKDDGTGFEPDAKKDARTGLESDAIKEAGTGLKSDAIKDAGQTNCSVGISNVVFRLRYMMNGSFQIQSSQGQGTTVTIRIPYWKERDGKK